MDGQQLPPKYLLRGTVEQRVRWDQRRPRVGPRPAAPARRGGADRPPPAPGQRRGGLPPDAGLAARPLPRRLLAGTGLHCPPSCSLSSACRLAVVPCGLFGPADGRRRHRRQPGRPRLHGPRHRRSEPPVYPARRGAAPGLERRFHALRRRVPQRRARRVPADDHLYKGRGGRQQSCRCRFCSRLRRARPALARRTAPPERPQRRRQGALVAHAAAEAGPHTDAAQAGTARSSFQSARARRPAAFNRPRSGIGFSGYSG